MCVPVAPGAIQCFVALIGVAFVLGFCAVLHFSLLQNAELHVHTIFMLKQGSAFVA
jgi:hypothetical protein